MGKTSLLLYKQLLLTMHFVIFDLYDTPTFKTKVLRLASNEGWVNTALPYSSLAITDDVFCY